MNKEKIQTNSNGTNIANLEQLQGVLGVKLQKVVKSSKTLTEKAQVMDKVNEAMHKLLITDFSKYYKHIETDVVITSKDGTHKIQHLNDWYLMFPKTLTFNGKQQEGYAICKPTTYAKGGNSYTCCYFKEVGKTTFNK